MNSWAPISARRDVVALLMLDRALQRVDRLWVGDELMLRMLPRQHREVLAGRYGLDGNSVRSHRQIARHPGVGEERSRQIEHESLRLLRSIPATLATAA